MEGGGERVKWLKSFQVCQNLCSEVKSAFTQIFNRYVRFILCSLSTTTDNTSKFGGLLC